MEKLVLATTNKGKIAELTTALAPLGVSLETALSLALPDVVEDQPTFEGNARKKAEEVAAATGLPALADDSGLCVKALGGAPGVLTARYGGIPKLLAALKEVPEGQRQAYFVCVLAFATPGQETRFFIGQAEGSITTAMHGEHGFAYDSVFTPAGHTRTFAQMRPEEKKALSHRGAALAQFLTFLQAQK